MVGWFAVGYTFPITPERREAGSILVASVFLFGWIFGFLARVILTRFLATLCHLPAGLTTLPVNWSRTLFWTDLATTPELVPGYVGHLELDFQYLYREVQSIPQWGAEKFIGVFIICLFFLPVYLYRLSIKSTFWLYWPLAYIANDASGNTRPAVLFDRLSATPVAWFSFLAAAATFVGFFVANFL